MKKVLIISSICTFFLIAIGFEYFKAVDKHNDFVHRSVHDKVERVEYVNHGNRIELAQSPELRFNIDFQNAKMSKYSTLYYSDFISPGDSVFKERGSLIVRVKKTSGNELILHAK